MRTRIVAPLIAVAASYLAAAPRAHAQGYDYRDPIAADIHRRVEAIRGHMAAPRPLPPYENGRTPQRLRARRQQLMQQQRSIYGNPYFRGRPTPHEFRNRMIIDSMRNH
jgi:hypothetical protein